MEARRFWSPAYREWHDATPRAVVSVRIGDVIETDAGSLRVEEVTGPGCVGGRFAKRKANAGACPIVRRRYRPGSTVLVRVPAEPIDRCPTCSCPAHASESTETGEHPACYTARTGEPTIDGEGTVSP